MIRRTLVVVAALLALPTVAAAQPAETIEYYQADLVGSIRIVYDAAGNVIGRQDYQPFGTPVLNGTSMPREGFGGNEKDVETQQMNFHARSLTGKTGRFTASDSLFNAKSEPQKWNRYAYAENNPLRYVDPAGLDGHSVNCGVGAYWCPGGYSTGPYNGYSAENAGGPPPVPSNGDEHFDPSQYGYHGGELDSAEAGYSAAMDQRFIDGSGFGNGGTPIRQIGDCPYYEHCTSILNLYKDGEFKCEKGCEHQQEKPQSDPWAPLPVNTRVFHADGALIGDNIFKVTDFAQIIITGSRSFIYDMSQGFLLDPLQSMAANAAIAMLGGAANAIRGREPTGVYPYGSFVAAHDDWCKPTKGGCR